MLEDPSYDRDEDQARDDRRWLVRVILVALFAVLLALAGGGAMRKAFGADGKPVLFDCAELAVNVAAIADFRDTGARLEPVVRLMRARFDLTEPELAVLEREIRRLWRERLPAEEAAGALYRRCRAQLGDMGRET